MGLDCSHTVGMMHHLFTFTFRKCQKANLVVPKLIKIHHILSYHSTSLPQFTDVVTVATQNKHVKKILPVAWQSVHTRTYMSVCTQQCIHAIMSSAMCKAL